MYSIVQQQRILRVHSKYLPEISVREFIVSLHQLELRQYRPILMNISLEQYSKDFLQSAEEINQLMSLVHVDRHTKLQ